jgi:PTS system nitrogen regulatory IIA component
MRLTGLIVPERVQTQTGVTSKKKALELLGELLGQPADPSAARPAAGAIFEALSTREKLGSTGLGHGVAIPHGRMADLQIPRLGLLRLREAVDFDSMDQEPVDLLVGLIVPESSTSEHLELLAELARWLSQPNAIAMLRRAGDDADLFATIVRSLPDA